MQAFILNLLTFSNERRTKMQYYLQNGDKETVDGNFFSISK